MPAELRATAALVSAAVVAYLLVPHAIRLAVRLDFLDRPGGYKTHGRATPYLGGVAILGAVLVGGFAGGLFAGPLAVVLAGAVVLWAVGTLDDRRAVTPLARVLVEVAVASGLVLAGLGWELFSGGALDWALTCLWVVGVVNAFNLMDNMDGAASVVATASAAGIALVASLSGASEAAILALALGGACLGFIPYNLANPARIFLGDGGSMPVGFLVAAGVMAVPETKDAGWLMLPILALLAGLPLFDTAMVIVSRVRRGVSIMTGGHDHITYRLLGRLGTVRRVAVALGLSQVLLGVTALGLSRLERTTLVAAAPIAVLGALALLVALTVWCAQRPTADLR